MNLQRLLTAGCGLALALELTGCASIKMSPPKATLATTASLRSASLAPANVGAFRLDASRPAAEDQSISLRGANNVASPIGGSFAQYLGESVRVELEAAGLYDAASQNVITGTLTRTEADAAIGTGKASLGAHFVVTRSGQVKYDDQLTVEDSWESSFMGATAIPMAAAHYEGLYRQLAAKLLDDPKFRSALAR
jgi:hypothetical protein